jgi:hypothetical protein
MRCGFRSCRHPHQMFPLSPEDKILFNHSLPRRCRFTSLVVLFLVPFLVQAQESTDRPKVSIAIDRFLSNVRNSTALCVGQFELVDFPRGNWAVTKGETGGRGTTWNFTIQFSGSQKARFYFYDASTPLTYGVQQCNTSDEAHAAAIVSGKVRDAVIQGKMLVRNDVILSVEIPKLVKHGNSVSAGISLLCSNLTPMARSTLGGTIELNQNDLAIDNRDAIISADDYTTAPYELARLRRSSLTVVTGSLRVNSPTAKMTLSVGLKDDPVRRQTLEFDSDAGTRTDIQIDLSSGRTQLQNGQFTSGEFTPTSDEKHESELSLGRVRVVFDEVAARTILLSANNAQLSGSLKNVSLAIVKAYHTTQPHVDVTGGAAAAIGTIIVAPEETKAGLDLRPDGLEMFRLASSKIRIHSGLFSLEGAGNISIEHADAASITGSLVYDQASISGLGGSAETATLDMLKLSGQSSGIAYKGDIAGQLKSLHLGKAFLSSDSAQVNGSFNTDGDLPVSVKTNQAGLLAITSGAAENQFEATLTKCDLKGVFSPLKDTLIFPPLGIDINIKDLKAQAARLLGGVPTFGTEVMSLSNQDPVVLDEKTAAGVLRFDSIAFSVTDPTLWTESKNYALAFGKNFVANGSTPFIFPLSRPEILPISGTLSIDDVNITLPPGIASVTVRASGLEVELSSLRIGHIELKVNLDVAALRAKADIDVNDIGIGAEHIANLKNPTFTGVATKEVKVDSFNGSVEVSSSPIEFSGLAIHNAAMTLKDIAYATPDGITFQSGTGEVKLEDVTETDATGNLKLSNSRVHAESSQTDATVQELSLQFTGKTATPSATGTINLGGISFVSNSGMQIENCATNYLPVRLSAQTGNLQGPVSMMNGQLSFLLASNDLQFQLFKDATLWQCEWDQKAGELAVSYPCCDNWCGGFIKYPCDCHICTHKIQDIMVRWQLSVMGVQASGMLTQIKLKPDPGKGIKPCEGHLTHLNPPVFSPTSPVIVPTLPGGNIGADIARAFIATFAAPIQTAVFYSIGAIGSLVSLTHIGNQIYLWEACE